MCVAPCSVALGQLNPVPPPKDVSGKVISDYIYTGDQQSNGTQNPHMTRDWDGTGDTTDSLDYTNSLGFVLAPGAAAPDVDALANTRDLFFNQLVTDQATLLVSPKVLQNDPAGGLNEIYFRTSSLHGSLPGVWAKNAPDIGGAPPVGDNVPPEGIDALEVWGGQDHNVFSLYNDPFDVTGRKVSLFLHDIVNNSTSAYIYNDDIRTALGLTSNDPEIDVDGLMVFDDLADGRFFTGDSILFSVSENQSLGGPFHGGEIWVWNFGGPATFLNHGGVVWDTVNQPALLFGWGGGPGEPINDINALEAIYFVPEPSSWLIAAVGIVLLGGFRARRRV